jgi:hypothetical protein
MLWKKKNDGLQSWYAPFQTHRRDSLPSALTFNHLLAIFVEYSPNRER